MSASELTLVERAAEIAAAAHAGQVRKQSGVPYFAHPCAVALALAAGGHPPETVAAGLLHDVIEDCAMTPGALLEKLGPGGETTVGLVLGATEPDEATHGWYARKGALIARAAGTDRELAALITADKSHNLRAILDEHARGGDPFAHFDRSTPADYAWLARTLAERTAHHDGAVFDAARAAVPAIEQLAA